MSLPPDDSPYSVPHYLPVAKLASNTLSDKELQCHQCGMLVPPKKNRCPHCGVRPQFDRLFLVVAAIIIAGVLFVYLMTIGHGRNVSRWELIPVFLVATVIVVPALGWIFSKFSGNKW